MDVLLVLLPNWLIHDGDVEAPQVTATMTAALEAWCWEIQPTQQKSDLMTLIDGTDPQSHQGALYEIQGELCWRERDIW